MKKLIFILSIVALASCNSGSSTGTNTSAEAKPLDQEDMQTKKSFYDFTVKDIDGKEVDLSQYKGQKVLVVNVASKCGYTPQYEDLQKLNKEYGDKIAILGFPANNFGGQEPGSNEEIKKFCTGNYGITFPMFEKVSVKGVDKHPLYRWLSDKSQNGWNDQEPTWNFCKYYIDENGELKHFFQSAVNPMDEEIIKLIES
ncbi:glutathione peroxidase [Echinicola strongylocentroti]|uniref:Glutathione peroxidase n=1 Tax=Echinicola strongylocentroti TaxID=1795355 RepID=A0A2Z4ILW7_9BACT|nr:glutathione peroxidase [Echinicola strongylocentroti]AWW31935.1 glutathione peroxidase [Echinicola strongylocentroti]